MHEFLLLFKIHVTAFVDCPIELCPSVNKAQQI